MKSTLAKMFAVLLVLSVTAGCAPPPWRTSAPADIDVDIKPESAIPKQPWTADGPPWSLDRRVRCDGAHSVNGAAFAQKKTPPKRGVARAYLDLTTAQLNRSWFHMPGPHHTNLALAMAAFQETCAIAPIGFWTWHFSRI